MNNMKTNIRWRVYRAPDGGGAYYCGEFEARAEAEAFADGDPEGTHESVWESCRAAGGQSAHLAPDKAGTEDPEPVGWFGAEGWHAVVRVEYSR